MIDIDVHTEDGYSKDLITCTRQSQASERKARSGREHSGISDNLGLPRYCRDESSQDCNRVRESTATAEVFNPTTTKKEPGLVECTMAHWWQPQAIELLHGRIESMKALRCRARAMLGRIECVKTLRCRTLAKLRERIEYIKTLRCRGSRKSNTAIERPAHDRTLQSKTGNGKLRKGSYLIRYWSFAEPIDSSRKQQAKVSGWSNTRERNTSMQ